MVKIINKVLTFIFGTGLSFNSVVLNDTAMIATNNKSDQDVAKIQSLLNEEFLVFYKNEVTDWNKPKIIQDIAYKKVVESINWLTFFVII